MRGACAVSESGVEQIEMTDDLEVGAHGEGGERGERAAVSVEPCRPRVDQRQAGEGEPEGPQPRGPLAEAGPGNRVYIALALGTDAPPGQLQPVFRSNQNSVYSVMPSVCR